MAVLQLDGCRRQGKTLHTPFTNLTQHSEWLSRRLWHSHSSGEVIHTANTPLYNGSRPRMRMTSVLRWPAVERVPAAHDTDMPCCWGSIVHTTKVTAGTGGRNVSINKWALNHSVNVLDALAGNTTEGGGGGGEGRGGEGLAAHPSQCGDLQQFMQLHRGGKEVITGRMRYRISRETALGNRLSRNDSDVTHISCWSRSLGATATLRWRHRSIPKWLPPLPSPSRGATQPDLVRSPLNVRLT